MNCSRAFFPCVYLYHPSQGPLQWGTLSSSITIWSPMVTAICFLFTLTSFVALVNTPALSCLSASISLLVLIVLPCYIYRGIPLVVLQLRSQYVQIAGAG